MLTRISLTAGVMLFACNPRQPPERVSSNGDRIQPADPGVIGDPPAKPVFRAGDLKVPASWTNRAPNEFAVRFETTKGEIIIDIKRSRAPLGVDRFFNLVKAGYFTDLAFFRAVPNFMVQFGIHGDPAINKPWAAARFADDPVTGSNTRGSIVFATAGPNTRTTQFFINLVDNSRLDRMGFAPFGTVRDMSNVAKINTEYGDGPPHGRGPNQGRISAQGNAYLKSDFPNLDYIKSATVIDE